MRFCETEDPFTVVLELRIWRNEPSHSQECFLHVLVFLNQLHTWIESLKLLLDLHCWIMLLNSLITLWDQVSHEHSTPSIPRFHVSWVLWTVWERDVKYQSFSIITSFSRKTQDPCNSLVMLHQMMHMTSSHSFLTNSRSN